MQKLWHFNNFFPKIFCFSQMVNTQGQFAKENPNECSKDEI